MRLPAFVPTCVISRMSVLSVLTASMLSVAPFGAMIAEASAAITAATGGGSISAATVGGTYTSLTGPVITEGAAGDVPGGGSVIVLKVATGFVFDTTASSVTATVTDVGTCTGGNKPIRVGTGGGATSEAVTPTSTLITVHVKQASSGTCKGIITYTGIKVRPSAVSPLASANITLDATSDAIAGVTAGTTNFGTLTEVQATTVTQLSTSASSVAYGTTVTFTALVKHGGSPTGTVTFKDGSTTIGTGSLGSLTSTGGTATLAISTLDVAGSVHSITAVYGGDTSNATSTSSAVSQTITQASQTITFNALTGKTFGDADFSVSATATSTLTVTFTSQTTGVCTVSSTTVHIVSGGTCTIRASQAGDTNYLAASNVDQSFTVAQASQTITFGALSGKTFGDADFGLSATADSGLTVTFTSQTTGVCTVSSTTVHIVSAGTCTILASQAGDTNYLAASNVDQSFTVAQASQTITFGSLTGKTFGDADFGVSATADSGLTVTFTSQTTGVCTVSSTTVHIVSGGTCTIRASQAGDTNYLAALDSDQSFTVAQASQTITFGSLSGKTYGDADFGISATADSGLTVTFTSQTTGVCTVSSTTVHIVSGGTCTIRASQAGDTNYLAASDVDQSFMVAQASQTITFGALSNKITTDPDFSVSATATSTLTVTFTSQTTGVCTVSSSTVHLVSAGTCTIRASQAGDTNYLAASDVDQSFTVSDKLDQTISVTTSALASAAYNDTFPVAATATSGLSVVITTTGGCSITTGTVTITSSTVSCVVHYNQAGDSTYNAAPEVTETTTVTLASQSITFGALAGKTLGDADFGVSATATSTLTVTFTSQTTGVCTVSSSTVHLVAAGTCTIRASQAGDTNYFAALDVDQSFTVAQAVTITLTSSDTNPAMDTDTITFTATVTGQTPTGNVSFKDNGVIIGTGSLAAGSTTFATSLSGNGATHPITAVYLGDTNNLTSTSNTVNQVVNTLPKLTVTKVVVNDNGGTKVITDFTFKIDSTAVTSGVQNTSTVGVHTVSEVADSGYTTTISGDCAADGSITLALNDVKSCTITNDDIQPKLTFTKVVVNDNGGTKTISNFPLKVGTVSATSGTQSGFNVGTYALTESGSLGYSATFSGDCDSSGNITLALADVKSCTMTNDDIAPKITVTKVLVTDNGGTQIITDFPLFVDSTPVTSAVQITTTIGLHTISETAIPSQYTSIIAGDCASDGTITLGLGEVKSCVITNDDKPAHLFVIKQVTNDNGGTKVSSGFTMNVTGVSPSQTSFFGADTPGTDITINAGSYSVAETLDSGYAVTYSADCVGSMLPGDTKTCTVTNDDIQPLLTVTKVVVNDNGGTKVIADFPLFVDSSSVTSGDQNGFDVGVYTVSETGMPTTYAATFSGDCSSTGSIVLNIGDTKTCTITNNDIAPTLQIIKNVINTNGGTATPSGFTLKVGTQIVLNGELTTLNVGDYIVGELESTDYDGTFSGDCSPSNGVVQLGLGENKVCIITNHDREFVGHRNDFPREGQVNGGHGGGGVGRTFAAAKFMIGRSGIAPGAFGGGQAGPITSEEKKILCAMQKTAEYKGNDALTGVIGTYLASLLGRPNPAPVINALKDPGLCSPSAVVPTKQPVAKTIRLNKDGFVLSNNPVWNACIRGKATLGLIKSNTDKIEFRQGSIVTQRPMSCDDYHTNSFNVWQHPDFAGLELSLDKKGHLIGGVPAGFIAVRDQTKTAADTKKGSIVKK